MIEIKYSRKKRKMTITGHAGYAEEGKDIVCSAVSTLVGTFTNLYDVTLLEDDMNHMEIEWQDADTAFLMKGLELVECHYPENVRIIRE